METHIFIIQDQHMESKIIQNEKRLYPKALMTI
jgi:hypothetical protein